MNFLDMSRDDLSYYNQIRRRDDDLSWLLKNLAILTVAVVIAALIVGFV